jgi:hypothetical protein
VAIVYHIVFIGGPCNGKRGTITTGGNPPEHVTCRGSGYTLAPAWSTERAVYTFTDPPPEATRTFVRGQRDVFQAWHYFMRSLRDGQAKEVAALVRARRRIGRAVR